MNNPVVQFQPRQAPAVAFDQQVRLAESFAKSGLFGIKTADQALALMALCEAEGLHPAIAVRDYHIIQGKPSLKADAMMARFQAAGGKVRWTSMTDERVSGVFSHPSGGEVEMHWDKARAITAGFWGKDNWKKFPRAMLRARVISEGIRTVFPGVVIGVYTPEEVQDFEPAPKARAGEQEAPQEQGAPPPISGAGVCNDDFDAMDDEQKKFIGGIADQIRNLLETEGPEGAYKWLDEQKLLTEEKTALWSLLDSKERSALKKASKPAKESAQ